MPAPIVVISLERTDNDGNSIFIYQAFSSSDTDRQTHKLLKDVYYTIGYQYDIQPDNIHTLRGILSHESHTTSSTTLQQRGHEIRCVMKTSGDIHLNYPIRGSNVPYPEQVPQTAGSLTTIPHEVIDPYHFNDNSDSDSDSDSDSS
jgi:hypothetical protein